MTAVITSQLAGNLQRVHDRIASACERSNRSVSEVTLVAVTKYAQLDWVQGLVDLGVTELGESRPQQLIARARQLPGHLHWHLIGHLQRNKVDLVLPVASRFHSVDSIRLLEAMDAAARKLGLRPRVLLEVNVSGEASKDGFAVDDVVTAWTSIMKFEGVVVEGLMTMAPLADQVEAARPVFRSLRQLRDRLRDDSEGRCPLPELSMGMSGDFEIGIEEGATLIRVGGSLFEGLKESSQDVL